MTKLNQVNAIEKSTKTRVYEAISEAHKTLQKDTLFSGVSRTYRPKDEEGESLPPEEQKVAMRAENVIGFSVARWAELMDVSATRDVANCKATADVEVNGLIVLPNVPVTYLLFLEKQLADLHTFVKKLPVLPATEAWHLDATQDLYATKPFETSRTKKLTRAMVLYEATKEHPAQVKEVTEDVLVGYWQTIKYSGALPANQVNEMVHRVEQLQKAVKFAREKANETEAPKVTAGKPILEFVFAPST